MRFRPLLAAVAAAGLLAAGCDYWRNLVGDNPLATGHLKVKVTDVYTGNALIATCTDSTRGLDLKTATSGEAGVLDAGTGRYTIRCRTTRPYYDKVIGISLTPAGETVEFGLARFGGEGWYKGDTLMEVRIRERFDTLRYPGELSFNAYPEDNPSNRFRYEWTFAKAKHLDLTRNDVPSEFPRLLRTREDLVDMVPGPDTLTLRVWSLMDDPEVPYPIGEYKRPIVWARNQLPRLSMAEIPEALNLAGCPESQPIRINYTATDPDGECKSVRFYTVEKGSSLGTVDTTFTCDVHRLQLPLKSTLEPLRSDFPVLRDNELGITVTDDNGGRFDTSIVVKTRSNILPTVKSNFENLRTYAFTGESIKLYFVASDSDAAPKSAVIHWADEGETFTEFERGSDHTKPDSGIWSFQTAGRKSVEVIITDDCNATVASTPISILIRDNRNPEVKVKYLRDEGRAPDHIYVLQITPGDKDISEHLDDRITEVHANWNEEGSIPLDPPAIGQDYIWKVHVSQPPDSLGGYSLHIDVHDSHNGSGSLDTLIRIP